MVTGKAAFMNASSPPLTVALTLLPIAMDRIEAWVKFSSLFSRNGVEKVCNVALFY